MSAEEKKNLKWWLKTTLQVGGMTLVTFAPELFQLFPEHTLLFKMALPLGFAIKLFGTKLEYQKGNLPEGMTKLMDRIPNRFTGEKGSKK